MSGGEKQDVKHNQRVASYMYWDSPSGHNRLHHWSNGKWAMGCGPIDYIERDRAKEVLHEWFPGRVTMTLSYCASEGKAKQ